MRIDKTYCSQCGGEFGPGTSGYSHCDQHEGRTNFDGMSDAVRKTMLQFESGLVRRARPAPIQ
jgi:hypothetical protein